jgi:hypothetical protein
VHGSREAKERRKPNRGGKTAITVAGSFGVDDAGEHLSAEDVSGRSQRIR